jgi:hypothetical protein
MPEELKLPLKQRKSIIKPNLSFIVWTRRFNGSSGSLRKVLNVNISQKRGSTHDLNRYLFITGSRLGVFLFFLYYFFSVFKEQNNVCLFLREGLCFVNRYLFITRSRLGVFLFFLYYFFLCSRSKTTYVCFCGKGSAL